MSANTGILTYQNGFFNVAAVYYSPSAILPITNQFLSPMYCFLSKVDPWTNESVPPVPEQTQKYLNQVYNNMFVAKKVTTNDMSPIIERIDWVNDTVYDYYRDDVDMYTLDNNGTILKHFYVKNRFDQVFKCLWNNNDGPSTVEPKFEPGTFNANQIFQGSDDYKWKYMYTITSGNKLKFMDDSWMPVPIGTNIPNPVSSTAGRGDIEVINITNSGQGYDAANADIMVIITGDGKYASANVVVDNGSITDITIANTGINYTYANVSIISAQGSGATASSPVSPIGGHGYDPVTELGARHIMITAKFEKDEAGNLPTNIDFRQIGLITNPFAYFGTYVPDEILYQSTDGTIQNAYFSATLLSFDSTFNVAKLINIKGTASDSALLIGATSGTARVVLQQRPPAFIPFSGYLTYLENREAVQRNADGSEQFKLVIGY
jgi:hypothetical protein